jgi:3-methyladenine DNA glycosylase AlkD
MNDEKVGKCIEELRSELVKNGKASDKIWQERYMKGVIPFHGVKVPQVRTLTKSLIVKHELKKWSEISLHDLAKQLLEADFSEEKLAGILVLSTKGLTLQDWEEQLSFIKKAFRTGQIADWATCDQVKTIIALLTSFKFSTFAIKL